MYSVISSMAYLGVYGFKVSNIPNDFLLLKTLTVGKKGPNSMQSPEISTPNFFLAALLNPKYLLISSSG